MNGILTLVNYLECAQTLTNEAYLLYYKEYKNFPRAIS